MSEEKPDPIKPEFGTKKVPNEKTLKMIMGIIDEWTANTKIIQPTKVCTLCSEPCYADEFVCPECAGYNFMAIEQKSVEVPEEKDKS